MDVFTAIAEPSRRLLLEALLEGPQPVNRLVEQTGMSQPLVSKHLRILREAALVTVEPDGQRRLYSLASRPLAEIDDWLSDYRRFFSARFDALERHLAATAETTEREKDR